LTVILIPVGFSCDGRNDKIIELEGQDTITIKDTITFTALNSLFQNKCYHCHSESQYSFYALNLDSYENTMAGSQNGPVVIPYEPENSLLYKKCSGEYTAGDMMPQDDISYFDNHPEKLQLIFDWIYFGCIE